MHKALSLYFRKYLSLKREITTIDNIIDNKTDNNVSCIVYLKNLVRSISALESGYILIMDESSIWFHMTNAITIDKTRRKQLPSEVMVAKKNAYLSTHTNRKKFIVFHKAKCQAKSLYQNIKIKGAIRPSLNSVTNEEIRPDWVKIALGQFRFIEHLCSLVVSDLRSETIGSRFNFGCYLRVEVSSLH